MGGFVKNYAKQPDVASIVAENLGVIGLFEVAISSHQVGLGKPDPGIYLAALERLGVPPHAVMFFDDVGANVTAASEFGIVRRTGRGHAITVKSSAPHLRARALI